MYFFTIALLLLVAPSICAPPMRLESRGRNQSVMSGFRVTVHGSGEAYRRWEHRLKPRIAGWSHPDDVFYVDSKKIAIIKRVKLSAIEPKQTSEIPGPSQTDRDPREIQIEAEKSNLIHVGQLLRADKVEVNSKTGDSVEKTYYYFMTKKMGFTALASRLSEQERAILRERGIQKYSSVYNMVPDPEHNNDDHFAYPNHFDDDSFAHPIFWRYATFTKSPSVHG